MERDLGTKVERDLGLKMCTDFGTHFSVRASALCDPYRKSRAAVPKNGYRNQYPLLGPDPVPKMRPDPVQKLHRARRKKHLLHEKKEKQVHHLSELRRCFIFSSVEASFKAPVGLRLKLCGRHN